MENCEETQEYSSVSKLSYKPVAGVRKNKTLHAGGSCSLYVLLGMQIAIVLFLIILLGFNDPTQKNQVFQCGSNGSSTGASKGASTGASTGASNGATNTSQQSWQTTYYTEKEIEQLNNITGILQMLQDTLSNQLLPLTRSQANISSSIYNLTRNADTKVNLLKSDSDIQTTYILNLTDSNYELLQTMGAANAENITNKLTNIIGTLSDLNVTSTSTAEVADDISQIVQELQNATSVRNPIRLLSCKDIKAVLPNSPTGVYHVNSRTTYCNMDTLCGSGGGWTRIGYLDMTQPTHSCPSSLTLYEEDGYRVCRRSSNTPSCNSIILQNNGISYSQICGKVTAYQYRAPDAVLSRVQTNNISSFYLDGISITRGSPRQHVWSLMVGLFENSVPGYDWANCPCATGSPQTVQSFIGNNYYCESGNPNTLIENSLYSNDELWDGQDCGNNEASCCTAPGQPWFHRDYGTNTTSDHIELRLCGDNGWSDEDAMISKYEIYIK